MNKCKNSSETALVGVITHNLVTVLTRLYRRLISPYEHRDSKETGQLYKVGGRLTKFLKEWHVITSDRWVLEVIQKGYALEFIQNPPTNWGLRCTPVPVKPDARKFCVRKFKICWRKM